MYKKPFIPITLLGTSLSRNAGALPVSAPLYNYMDLLLSDDDWTYLAIAEGSRVEIVKIVDLQNGSLLLARGVDDTLRQDFTANATIYYTITQAEILDTFDIPKLTLDGIGAVRMFGPVVSIPEVSVIGLGGVENGLPIQEKINALCCPTDAAPEIPLSLLPIRTIGGGEYRTIDEGDFRTIR